MNAQTETQAAPAPTRTAKYKNKKVAIIRYSTKNCRICPMTEYEAKVNSDVCFSDSCELVPTNELTEVTDVKKTKKKKKPAAKAS